MQVFDDQPVLIPEELPRFRHDCHGVLPTEPISPNSKTFPASAEKVGLGSSTPVLYFCQSHRGSAFPTILLLLVALDITRPIRS
jgi:hypothetical protein